MKKIELTLGMAALVDDEDYERFNKYMWWANEGAYTHYAYRSLSSSVKIGMHRELLFVPPGMEIDHIDGDGLNNQKHNLRICTRSQNGANQKPQKNVSSKYKGVTWEKGCRKWRAQIMVNKRNIRLGTFKSEKDGAMVYNVAALKYFGDFARLNNID